MPETVDLRTAWTTFCDRLKDGADVVLDPDLPIDEVDRSEGLRALLRRLSSEVSRDLEGGGTSHPELAWVHPFKNGQDNPDGLYQLASLDLSRTYRLSGTVGSVRYLGITAMTTDFSWKRSAKRYVEIFKWAKMDPPYQRPHPFHTG